MSRWRRAVTIIVVGAVLTGCAMLASAPQRRPAAVSAPAVRATHESSQLDFDHIRAMAPLAFTGPCRIERRPDGWVQPAIGEVRLPSPVPCYNVRVSVGMTDGEAPKPHQMYMVTSALRPDGSEGPTKKMWIRVRRQHNGAFLVTWGAKRGVKLEGVLADTATKDGLKFISVRAGRYVWHPYGEWTYPVLSVYANDPAVARKIQVGITGPPLPRP